MNSKPVIEGRFAYDRLERTIHEKARLGILTSLAMHPGGLLFTDLKKLCNLTDGNLNRHLAVLDEGKLVDGIKTSGGGAGRGTMYRLTPTGRRKLVEYVEELERVVRDVEAATGEEPGNGGGDLRPLPQPA